MNRMLIPKVARKLFLTSALVLLAGPLAFAQQTVRGTVSDAVTGEVLIGTTVSIKSDPSKGTISGADGSYSIMVNRGETLIFSYVGYLPQEVVVAAQTTINVSLNPSLQTLADVVVIGYGTQKKEDATGSVTAISSDDFNKGAIATPQELLAGRTAGVQITTGGGAPGEGSTIRIRGGSSLSASNDPLIVVDGIPLDNESVAGMRNPLNTINPNDIESFTVLKDASATAIYGSRASNGVIIITTKKSEAGSKLKFDYTGKYSLNTLPNQLEVLDADAFRAQVQEIYANNPNALALLGEANTDWQKEVLQTALSHDHNVSASGAVGILPFRASFGYSDLNGILKTDNMNRFTGSLNLNPSFLNNHLRLNINLKGMTTANDFANRGALGSALAFDPTQPVYDSESPYGGYFTWVQPNGDPISIATQNPVAQLMMRTDVSRVNRLMGNIQADYRFHFLPELRANLNIATDRSNSKGYIDVPDDAMSNYVVDENGNPIGGVDREYQQSKLNDLLDFYLNYVKETSVGKFDVMAGYSWQHFWRQGTAYETNVLGTIVREDSDYETESYLVSFFGRLNYSLKDKYLLTFTLRNDGSSRFAPENRWGLFPSAAFAWKLKQESFLKDVDVISDLKLRIGYGVTGQQNITSGDYPYLARYTFSEQTARYQFGDTFVTTLRPEGYDANLKWEETSTINLGLDYGFFKDRLIGSVEYYYRETKDLINTIPVPAGTNLTNQILTNVGNLTNRGVELNLVGRPIVTEDLFWELGYNITFNKNEITKLTASDDPNYLGVYVGGISGGVGNTIQIHSVGYPSNTYFVYEQVYDTEGKPIEGLYVDRNGDGVITGEDRYHLYKPAPDVFMGFSSRLNYKNWDFSFAGRVNLGNYNYNNVSSNLGVLGGMYNSVGYLINVIPEAVNNGFTNWRYFSDYYIQDASFLRLDNVSLGYQIDNLIKDRANLYLSLTVQNALVITKYKGLDPEVFNGIDNNIYPRPRIFMLGVKLEF